MSSSPWRFFPSDWNTGPCEAERQRRWERLNLRREGYINFSVELTRQQVPGISTLFHLTAWSSSCPDWPRLIWIILGDRRTKTLTAKKGQIQFCAKAPILKEPCSEYHHIKDNETEGRHGWFDKRSCQSWCSGTFFTTNSAANRGAHKAQVSRHAQSSERFPCWSEGFPLGDLLVYDQRERESPSGQWRLSETWCSCCVQLGGTDVFRSRAKQPKDTGGIFPFPLNLLKMLQELNVAKMVWDQIPLELSRITSTDLCNAKEFIIFVSPDCTWVQQLLTLIFWLHLKCCTLISTNKWNSFLITDSDIHSLTNPF